MVCVRRTGWRRLASDDVGEKRSTGGAERDDDERSPAPGSGRCVSDGTLSDAPLRSSLHWHGSSRIRVSKYDVRPSVDIDSVSCLRQPDSYTAAETYAGRVGAPPIIRNRINDRKRTDIIDRLDRQTDRQTDWQTSDRCFTRSGSGSLMV